MSFEKEWGDVFNKAIQSFTGRNKVGGTPERNALEDVVKETKGLVASLKTLDEYNPKTAKDPSAAVKAFGKEKDGPFVKEKAKYDKILDDALKLIDKQTWPAPYRDLKVLKTQLNLVNAKVDSAYDTYSKDTLKETKNITDKIEKKEKEVRKKGGDDKAVADETYVLKAQKMLQIWIPATKTALAKAAAAVQQIKADPTPATYNKVMDSGGRDMSQQFLNLIKLVKDPKAKDWSLVQNMPDLSPFEGDLKAFGNGDKRTVEKDTTPQDILNLTKDFSQMMKGLIPLYGKIEVEIKKAK